MGQAVGVGRWSSSCGLAFGIAVFAVEVDSAAGSIALGARRAGRLSCCGIAVSFLLAMTPIRQRAPPRRRWGRGVAAL